MKNRYDKCGFWRDLTISLGDLAGRVVWIWSYFSLCQMPSCCTSQCCIFSASLVCLVKVRHGLNQVKMYWLVIREAVRESESPVSRAHSCTQCWDQQSNWTHYSFIKFQEVSVLVMHQYYDNTNAGCVQSTSKITAGYRCEVICFQLPSLPCYKVSVQLIISALHPPVFKMHYHNAPERRCRIAITQEFNQRRQEKLHNFHHVFMPDRNELKYMHNFQHATITFNELHHLYVSHSFHIVVV